MILPVCGRCLILVPIVLGLACAGSPEYLNRYFPGPPVQAEVLEALEEMPADMAILPDGRWAVRAAAPEASPDVEYRVDAGALRVPVNGGRFDARVENVLQVDGRLRVAASSEAGVLVAAARRSSTRPGTAILSVRLADGTTRTVAAWDMSDLHGYLDVDGLSLSPGGTRLALQLREMRPRRRGGVREVGRRGVVLAVDDAGGAATDLGPDVVGPMRWNEDGTQLYFLRREGRKALVSRVSLPAERPLPAPAEPAGPAVSGEADERPSAEPRRVVAFTREELVAAIVGLSSDDATRRLAAAAALASMPDPMAVGPLLTAMEGRDTALCRSADRALRSILAADSPPAVQVDDAEDCARAAAEWRAWWAENPESLQR